MAYDDRALAQAARQLAPKARGGKGQEVAITGLIPAGYNPLTDEAESGGDAVQIGSGIQKGYDARSIDGTLIQRGDKQFLLSPLQTNGQPIGEIVPDRDVLTKADGQWMIRAVETVAPAGMAVLYKLQLRRGG